MHLTAKPLLLNPILTGRLVLLLMVPSLLIDSITGWMSMNLPLALSLSQLYRSGMLAVMFLWLALFWIRGFMLLTGLLTLTFVFMTWHSLSATSFAAFGMDLRFNLSLFANFFYFIFLYGYLNQIKGNAQELIRSKILIDRVVLFSFYVLAINIVLGILGIGYSTLESYVQEESEGGGGAGGKGFFTAGNDLSSVFLVVAAMLLIKIWSGGGINKYYLVSGALLFLAVMLLTKAVILGTLILIIGIPLCMSRVVVGWRVNYRPLLPLIFGLSLGFVSITWLIWSDSALVRRSIYLFESADLLAAVTTGRSYFFAAAMEAWSASYNQIDWLFGKGQEGFLTVMQQTIGREKSVEIDYADIFMMNGALGLAIVVLIWGVYLKIAWFYSKCSLVARGVLFVDLLLLGLAATSGHVLYSAMNGMFIALLNIMPLLDYRIQRKA